MKNQSLDITSQINHVMRLEDFQVVQSGTVSTIIDAEFDHIVELTAHEDSAWLIGDTPPADLYSGFLLPEGMKAPYFVKAGETIAVFGKLTIAY